MTYTLQTYNTGQVTKHIRHMTITFAYARAGFDDVDPRSKQKEQVPLGQRIRAVACAFTKKGTLRLGIITSCIEKATIPNIV